MKTDDLIQDLVADARPVRRLQTVDRRCVRWVTCTLFLVAIGTIAWGLRSDLSGKVQEGVFLLENSLLLLVFGLAARSAFQLSVPGDERPVFTLALPLFAFLLWFSLIVVRHCDRSGDDFGFSGKPGLLCITRIVCLGAIPVVAGAMMLRRAAPGKTAWTGFFMSISAFCMATVGTQALCPTDRPQHILLWHFLPVFLIGLSGALLGKLVFETRGLGGQQQSPPSA